MSQPEPTTHAATDAVTLVIEVSNPGAGENAVFVALGAPLGGLIDHEPLSPLAGGRDDLHPAIQRLCARAGVSPERVARVAVSAGPGGYTSLRVAVAGGALIAHATGAQTVEIPTARLVARSVPVGPSGGNDADSQYPRGVALASKGDACHLTVETAPDTFNGGAMVRAAQIESIGLRVLIADSHLPGEIRAEAQRLGIDVVDVAFSPAAACVLAAELPPSVGLAVRYAREPDAVTQWRARSSGRG